MIPDNKILPSYQCLVGSLTYLAICMQPDIAYMAMALGQFNVSPTRTHLACAKGILRYWLVHFIYHFNFLPLHHSLHHSLSPHVVFQMWTGHLTKKYYALMNTIKEGIWMKLFLSLTSLPLPTPFPIFCDNQSTCTIANTDVISSQTKHIDILHHFICQLLNDGSFNTVWLPTDDIKADILTKPLLLTLFLCHHDSLGLVTP